MKKTINLVLLGSDSFSTRIFTVLSKDKRFNIVGLITKEKNFTHKTRSALKPDACEIFCEKNEIKLYHWDSNMTSADFGVNLAFLCSFGAILPNQFLNSFSRGVINLHPSLLPLYRGASPLQSVVLDMSPLWGISLLKTVAKMDAGPLIYQTQTKLSSHDTFSRLQSKVVEWASVNLSNILYEYYFDKLALKIQDESATSYCYKINNADLQINWDSNSKDCCAKINAFSNSPGAWTILNNQKCKILEVVNCDRTFINFIDEEAINNLQPGGIYLRKNTLYVKTKTGWIEVLKLQLANKNVMSAASCISGYKVLLSGNCFTFHETS